MLAEVEERLQKLENTYNENVLEKSKLEANINRTQARLGRSDLLVAALSDEQKRWENNIKVYYHNICVYILALILFTICFILDVIPTSVNRYW
jgi:hypothetical protein